MRIFLRIGVAMTLGLLSLVATGCPECQGVVCDACDVPLHLMVTDANTGLSVPGVEVTGVTGGCQERNDGSTTDCLLQRQEEPWGIYRFELSAPGYVTRSFEETVPASEAGGCCNCGYLTVTAETTLTPS